MSDSRLRWGDNAPSDPEFAQDRLLNAAEVCFGRFGIAKTTIEDVAKEASVSRATVYRYFSGVTRSCPASSCGRPSGIWRRSDRGSMHSPISVRPSSSSCRSRCGPPAGTRRWGCSSPATTGSTREGSSTERRSPLFELVEEFLTPVFEARSDEMAPGLAVSDASECILRAILSFLTVQGPKRRSTSAVDGYLRCTLLPAMLRSEPASSVGDGPPGRPG